MSALNTGHIVYFYIKYNVSPTLSCIYGNLFKKINTGKPG